MKLARVPVTRGVALDVRATLTQLSEQIICRLAWPSHGRRLLERHLSPLSSVEQAKPRHSHCCTSELIGCCRLSIARINHFVQY